MGGGFRPLGRPLGLFACLIEYSGGPINPKEPRPPFLGLRPDPFPLNRENPGTSRLIASEAGDEAGGEAGGEGGGADHAVAYRFQVSIPSIFLFGGYINI